MGINLLQRKNVQFEEVFGMQKRIEQKSSHVLILRGKRGRKLFEQVKNAPTVPYERLKAESEAFKKEILKKRSLS